MDFDEFKQLAKEYNCIPAYEKITADFLTPIAVYAKMRNKGSNCFLLESVEGADKLARYSFIGKDPDALIQNSGCALEIKNKNGVKRIDKNIFDYLNEYVKTYKRPAVEGIPYFTGGLVGYIGYENISLIEPAVKFNYKNNGLPDSILGFFKTIVAFDHFKRQIIIISNAIIENETDIKRAYDEAINKIKIIKSEILTNSQKLNNNFKISSAVKESVDKNTFYNIVEKSKKNIVDGDIFQIVISKRYSANYEGDLFNVYRALRIINPSPYMYFVEFENNFSIIGASPENLIKIQNGKAELLPIAGTRRRGKTIKEDEELEKNLLTDPKEAAEHTMLVDLGRNDLGRVCEYNSIELIERMKIYKYSHVMHLVSRIEGKLRKDKTAVDALTSCFPAGTVTGAPKIRAMQLIQDYENLERNVYAGAIGYVDFSGNLDMCIAIRTLFAKDNLIEWQAGAGLVADSKPELEDKEIKNKSAVLVNALQFAEKINEDACN